MSQIKTPIVNAFKISQTKDCGELNLIDANLNEGTKGPALYLCIGNDKDNTAAPVTDIFIWNKQKNQLPKGFACESTDLNKGAGGNDIFFCYKKSILPLSDPVLVSDITVISSKDKDIKCPTGYDIVKSEGCDPEGCDANDDAGGN